MAASGGRAEGVGVADDEYSAPIGLENASLRAHICPSNRPIGARSGGDVRLQTALANASIVRTEPFFCSAVDCKVTPGPL